MFCFCPLYNLVNCGGNPRFTDKGIKDCSNCIVPHKAENYRYIMEKIEN
jgi:Zn-finger protein